MRLGTNEHGQPFYAMRFVRGQSLKEAVESFHQADHEPGRDPAERTLALRQLLGRFIDVCHAIAYAHSRGVLHRDLKPANILLGPYGETLVVDWGLAKVVGRDDPTPRPAAEMTLRPASPSGSSETMAGTAIGTPMYMSPEQAEGRLSQIGPASDIYCLGATLYCLLTGRPAIEDLDVEEILARVRRGAIRPAAAGQPPSAGGARSDRPESHGPASVGPISFSPGPGRGGRALAGRRAGGRMARAAPGSGCDGGSRGGERRWPRSPPPCWLRRSGSPPCCSSRPGPTPRSSRPTLTWRRPNQRASDANRELLLANTRERARFELSLEAIKTFHGGVSEDLLLKEKQFDGLRTKLLRGATDFYRRLEILLAGQEDHRSRAALGQAYHDIGELTAQIGSQPRRSRRSSEAWSCGWPWRPSRCRRRDQAEGGPELDRGRRSAGGDRRVERRPGVLQAGARSPGASGPIGSRRSPLTARRGEMPPRHREGPVQHRPCGRGTRIT